MVMALQCRATRVATFVLDWEGADRDYQPLIANFGGSMGYHAASHDNQPKLRLLNKFMVEKYAYFLSKMKARKEGNGTLLNNALCMFGSGFSNSPSLHSKQSIPIVLAGNACGAVQTGRAIAFPSGTNNKALLLTLIQKMGVSASSINGSSATVSL
jgi:hypothetical protein